MFTLSRFTGLTKTDIATFETVEAARAHLKAEGWSEVAFEEDRTAPDCYDVAAAKGPTLEIFTIERTH